MNDSTTRRRIAVPVALSVLPLLWFAAVAAHADVAPPAAGETFFRHASFADFAHDYSNNGFPGVVAVNAPNRSETTPANLAGEVAADPARQAFRAQRREAAHRQRRLIFNNDGDDAAGIPRSQPPTAESLLARRTTPLLGSQVDTIFYCSLCGPKSYHPSEVSETYTVSRGDIGYYDPDSPSEPERVAGQREGAWRRR